VLNQLRLGDHVRAPLTDTIASGQVRITLPRGDATAVVFDQLDLTALRHALTGQAMGCGLTGSALDDFVLAVSEIAANAVTHGGGNGRLLLWCDDDRLRCEISDDGPGLAEQAVGDRPPPPLAEHGRGLWLASQLCGVEIASGPYGTTVGLAVVRPAGPAAVSDAGPADGGGVRTVVAADAPLCRRCRATAAPR
jgi:anti-sigma regulatory factor (Ser/Thr protein kinase)